MIVLWTFIIAIVSFIIGITCFIYDKDALCKVFMYVFFIAVILLVCSAFHTVLTI